MRIVYIVAGAGGMYCGACARDVNLVRELIARGHDVDVVALYTPLHADEESTLGSAPIFYGGINVYLQQVASVFQHTPATLDRMLDNPSLLNWVSKFAIRTRAEDLGPMTVSVLEGKSGKQKKELARLLDYLDDGSEKAVVNITNSLLSGIAPDLKARLNVPVVCTLQGEDGFVGVMPEPYRSEARRLMAANSRSIDAFISPGESYAARMSEFLSAPREKIHIVRAGINIGTYSRPDSRVRSPITIGYLSSITPAKGLDILVDAFADLSNTQGRDARLRIAGKVVDQEYWNAIKKRMEAEGLSSRYEYVGEIDLEEKVQFLRQCSVFAVPSRIEESRGMAVMEAMASGVPVLVPDTGVFPEMIELTGGGVVVPSGDSEALASAVAQIMDDPDHADAIGNAATTGIGKHYNSKQMAEQTLAVYASLLQ